MRVNIWLCFFFFFFKQKTAYEMRISDWSSDVCSSDLLRPVPVRSRILLRVRGVEARQPPRDALVERRRLLLQLRHRPHALRAVLPGELRAVDRHQFRAEQALAPAEQIGRASWRERVWQSV